MSARRTYKKIKTLQRKDNGSALLDLQLCTFGTGRQVYYFRSYLERPELANGQTRVGGSLGTDDETVAIQRAYAKQAELTLRQEQGINIKTHSVSETMDRYLIEYEENLNAGLGGYSKNILRNIRKSMDIYWRDYVGEEPINNINENHLDGYEKYRRSYWKLGKRRKKGNYPYKEQIASSTLVGEINLFRQFLRWAAMKNLYQGQAYLFQYKTHENIKNRREAFSLEEYRKLTRYLRSKEYLNVGKIAKERGGKPDSRIVRHRHMMRCYILFMCNTGLRVGEARHLTWGDVSSTVNRMGERVCIVELDQEQSKVRKGRTRSSKVVGRLTAWRALDRYKEFLQSVGEDTGKKRYIFSKPNGDPLADMREGFAAVCKEAGVPKDKFGNKFVPYSCRHTYITFRLKYGKNLSIHSLAKNCRTSVEMIEQQYDATDALDFVDELTI